IHRTAKIIWVIKIIRTAGTISSKQNCLMCKSLQRMGISGAKKGKGEKRRKGGNYAEQKDPAPDSGRLFGGQ
ncbi:MAG: hypothetical protein PUF71_07530, partial [Firmicutes bacterium]|nr:hypothetical protein [Bacillota bacterium]